MAWFSETPRLAARTSRRLRRMVLGLVLSGLAAPALAASAQSADAPVPLTLVQMLRQRDFSTLERSMRAYHRAYDANPARERLLVIAYGAFESADSDLEKTFEAWAGRYPDSYAARLARAHYYFHLGWIVRGESYTNMPPPRLAAMQDYFSKASRDTRAALAIRPDLGIGYRLLISMAMVAGSTEAVERLRSEGVEADPNSLSIHFQYLESLRHIWRDFPHRWRYQHLPWWTAPVDVDTHPNLKSREIAQKIVEEYVRLVERDMAGKPWLKPLSGYPDWLRGNTVRGKNQRDRAAEYFRRALSFGDYPAFWLKLAKIHYRAKRYDKAIDGYTRALAITPQNPLLLSERAWAYLRQGDERRAFADWDLALALDPRNPEILEDKARAHLIKRRAREALDGFEKATLYGAHAPHIWGMIGIIQLRYLHRPREALPAFEHSLKLRPKRPDSWYSYGDALLAADWHNCQATDAFKEYLRLCAKGVWTGDCRARGLATAKRMIFQQKILGLCYFRSWPPLAQLKPQSPAAAPKRAPPKEAKPDPLSAGARDRDPNRMVAAAKHAIEEVNCPVCYGGSKAGLEKAIAMVLAAIDAGYEDKIAAYKIIARGYDVIGIAYTNKSPEEARRASQKYKEYLLKILALNPGESETRHKYAVTIRDKTERINEYRKIIEIDPDYFWAHYGIGHIRFDEFISVSIHDQYRKTKHSGRKDAQETLKEGLSEYRKSISVANADEVENFGGTISELRRVGQAGPANILARHVKNRIKELKRKAKN